jgi:hypothetical protein
MVSIKPRSVTFEVMRNVFSTQRLRHCEANLRFADPYDLAEGASVSSI